MKRLDVDVAILGAGTAGLTARREVERAGGRPVLIDGGPLGTTCARVGCMPSKLLVAAAHAAHEVRRASLFGIETTDPVVNGKQVLERVRRERDRFVGFVTRDIDRLPEGQLLRGHGRVVKPGTVRIDELDMEVHARAIVLAVGSSPFVPDSLAAAGDAVLTSDDVFELDDLPRSLAVIGAGVIGMELGQAMHRLGVRTTVFGASKTVAGLTDPRVRQAAIELFADELDLRLDTFVESAHRDGDEVVVVTTQGGERREERFQRILAATGRRHNLGAVGLDALGLALDARGVPVYDPRTMQCGDSPVFLAGDADGDHPVLHEAADEGRIAGENAARFPGVRAQARRTGLSIVFTDPGVAIAGAPFRDLPADHAVGEVRFEDQGRARVMGVNRGCLRVYGARSCGTLLGAEMVAPAAEHLAHLLSWAIARGVTVEESLGLPFYHPVLEEGLRSALWDLAHRLKLAPEAARLECGPGA